MKAVRAVLVALALTACISTDAQPVRYGLDDCGQCRMVITDQRYGAELVLATGKGIKFDAIECMLDYTRAGVARRPAATAWVIDFTHPGSFIDAESATYIQLPDGTSPMGRGLIATSTTASAVTLHATLGGTIKTWRQL